MIEGRVRGVTLIELMVALSIGAVVATSAVSIFAYSTKAAALARARAELERDGSFVQEILERELRLAGLGVPTGANLSDARAFPAGMVVAQPTELGFLADLPRPDSNYNALGMLSTLRDGDAFFGGSFHVWWNTENNGLCQPDGTNFGRPRAAPPACRTGSSSLFFPGVNGCETNVNDRTCPWALNRVVDNEQLQIAFGNGAWETTVSSMTLHSFHDLVWMSLSPLSIANWDVSTSPPGGTLPTAAPGQGFVTTLDRVFLRQNGTKIERFQCWGDPDPTNANWPSANGPVPAAPASVSTPMACVRGPGTPNDAEVIARNVDTVSFTYKDGTGAATASLLSIRQIDYQITFKKTVQQETVRHVIQGTITLRNI